MSTILVWNASAGECIALERALNPGVEASCCDSGILLPAAEQRFAYVIPWMLILCWVFSGVALGSEVFMTAIEVITSKENTTTVTVDGITKKFHTAIWNPTVANLTLMALGSSAPEILLNVIEILTGNFYAGELGPSTIVGSAAFNLMVITAVCIVCLPDGEVRRIEQLGVFLTTSAYSIFAYIWLLIIVMVWTPNIITVTEGVLTVVFLLLLVVQAFIMDRYTGTTELQSSYVTQVMDSGEEVIDPDEAASKIEKLKGSGLSLTKRMEASRIANFLRPKSRAHYRSRALRSLGSSGQSVRKNEPTLMTTAATEMVEVAIGAPGASAGKLPGKQTSKRKKGRAPPETKEQQAERRAKIVAPAGLLAWREDVVSVWENCGTVVLHVDRIGGSAGAVSVEYTTKEQVSR